MKCPSCQLDLVMSERQGIEIDYCPKCRGIWLDRGELDKIIERSALSTPATPASQHSSQNHYQPPLNAHDSHHGYPYKRKKSWLGELFD